MLTCIACSKQLGGGSLHEPEGDDPVGTPGTPQQAIKALTTQLKDTALKASGAYRQACKPPCSGSHSRRHATYTESDGESFHYSYRRAGESLGSTPRAVLGKDDIYSRMRGLSSGEGTPSMGKRIEGGRVVFVVEEEEPKEWVALVEPGVLITFLSLPQGGNDLKRIRFSREMFNKWQAQRWWAENYDKVMELYNVQKFNRLAVPLPTPPRSEDESSKMESTGASPVTPSLTKEHHPHSHHHRSINSGNGCSSSDSIDHHLLHSHNYNHSGGLSSTPKLSSISGAKTETSSMDASVRTTSSSYEEADQSGELSVSNASDQETEWVEQDEPGVYITIRSLPGGIRELRRVRFSRERFGETHARLWWEENSARIHEQYL